MRRVGSLDLPLHSGRAPRWLFERMVKLAKHISEALIIEQGKDYFLTQLSNPLWFQSLGCVLGFDWHSSGLTTTVCGALKEAFKDLGEYGLYFCGGKGASSRKTPDEIGAIGEKLSKDPEDLIYASKIVAKVDNNTLQDGFNLYHHTFIFTPLEKASPFIHTSSAGLTADFRWVVIQQGMSSGVGGWARRYHWHSENLTSFVDSPHQGISTDRHFLTLNPKFALGN